ncbi:Phage Tail Collar Domain [Citrobacter werkmanii]|uniref:Phage Tail Collar Domain n=1 Tax=Citrobacter werkmanii TaxID=67827 RepID=A0A9N8GSY7_9ENTR|nr:phage tail protein [Citrobacter werkmanii]CAB5542089.1 Phage Tail Collar Domain [Citrobacter werkmanii]CAB5552954.1 Phage Tail Collar Domain [Citrobacter werkmanii]CAB5567508.1 Phage Tail Collar Domain [Citrobacter werkmanii]CAB5571250.1 Phage Tail Collar Domain [Citrobacter werkmanii]CAB5582722.1 Phage Tail Collar Domain [Citrobacter werkmanii]
MATKYYAVLTNVGAAKLANATALGAQVEITQMAVGDGNGVLPTPNQAQTALVHELRRKPLNSLSIDPNNANQIIAEQVIPEDEGGWWIREIGLFDKDGDMIAVANCAETYKPQLQEGSGRVQVVRMILIVSSTAAVTLKIDPSVVLATRQYVDDQIIQVKSYVDQKMAAHVAAADPHKQYAPKESPALTGRPTAPTAEGKDSSTQIANTAFVQAAIAALVGSSPEALDTLNELAAALGNDPNFATTVTNSLAGKMDKSANGSDIENVSVFLQNLGLGEGSALPVGVPVPWPSATPPTGWLKCNGAAFSAKEYPELAKVYPTNKLPDLRGEFIRGWDDGRGVDAGRQLLSSQGDAIRNIEGFANGGIGMSFDAIGGAFYDAGPRSARMPNNTTIIDKTDDLGFDASRVVPTANENRPRNIAFNYIVRAA